MIYLLCEWANNVTPAGGCGIPSDMILISGAGDPGANQLYHFTGALWVGVTDANWSLVFTGVEWQMIHVVGPPPFDRYHSTVADFPCIWTIGVGTGPAPVGVYYADPIPDGAGGFWALIVDTLGNVGTQSVALPVPTTTTIILQDSLLNFWQVVVDPAGNRGTTSSLGPITGYSILFDDLNQPWQLIVDTLGNLGATH